MFDLKEPTYTRRVDLHSLGVVGVDSLLYGLGVGEERSGSIRSVLSDAPTLTSWCLEYADDGCCCYGPDGGAFSLFEAEEIAVFLSTLHGLIGIDLTGLENRVWAPLVRSLIDSQRDFVALYAEPADYRRSEELPGSIYDLSLSLGIDPLPGFAKVRRRDDDKGDFVPLLGFEGARLNHIIDQEEVEISRTRPIVGFPGFRLEYPTITYVANRDILSMDHMDQRVELAQASCPFEAFHAIERIHERIDMRYLRIAPIGTKPHALGAVLYAILHPSTTEIVYDNPVRSNGRSSGTRGVYVYEVSEFLEGLRVEHGV